MDDDDFNYEPEDLNSNDENEHKAKLYHFEDVPDVNIEEQKKIMDEIQQNNKKKEDEGNIFDLISDHGDNDKDKSKHDNIEIDDLLDEGEVKKNPPISEDMIKAMYRSMGVTPSQARLNQTMKAINEAQSGKKSPSNKKHK